ncbi:hypothetical protein Hanom_Chr04g00374111 [Helianthus anomalus]
MPFRFVLAFSAQIKVSINLRYSFQPRNQRHTGADPSPAQGGRAHPQGKKISAKFRRKSRPHPLEFFVRTPWNFSTAPLKFFVRTP